MNFSTTSENTQKTELVDKLSWWKNISTFGVKKTLYSSSILKKVVLDIDETTLKFIKKHKQAFESLAKK